MPNARTASSPPRLGGGLEHSVEVTACSLYETAVLGLKAFRESSQVEHCGPGPAGPLRVTVKAEESHEVKVQQLKAWLKSVGKSPREQALKTRLQVAARL